MTTRVWSRHVPFMLLFFIRPALGAQWPSHMRGASSHHAGHRPLLRSEHSGSHSAVAVASTARGQQVALNRIAHGQRSRFLPAVAQKGRAQPGSSAAALAGSRGTLPSPLLRSTGVQETPLVARSAATRHEEQNLFYIIGGKEMHTWEQKEPKLSDQQHADHNFEVGISGAAQPLTSLATGLEPVPMEVEGSRITRGSSMIDASSSQLGEKQAPTTGMLQSTTAAVLAATTGAPATMAADAAKPTAAPDSHRMSISMLLVILGMVVALALLVAYWFLARHRRHGPIDEVPNNSSLYKQRRASQPNEGRRHSRRASALMAEGLLSPREARDTREPMSVNPARDRSSGSRLAVPDPAARSSRAAVHEGTGRPDAEHMADLVLDNADFAAGARPSFGGSADAASGTGVAERSSLSYPQQKLGHNEAANPTPGVQVMSISTDTSNSTTPPPTPPRSPRPENAAAASAAARSKNGQPSGQTASEAEHSSSGLASMSSSTEKSADDKTEAVPTIIVKPAAPEAAVAGSTALNAAESLPEADGTSAVSEDPLASPNLQSPSRDGIVVKPAPEAVAVGAASPTDANEMPAADGAAGRAAVAEEPSYAAHRKQRRSVAKDAKDLDARSEESVSSSTTSEKSNYAAERRSRRSVLAADAAGPASIADGHSQSEYTETRKNRKSVLNDDAAAASASAAAGANEANSSSGQLSNQRRSSTSARKSVGRIMAMQNEKAGKDDDDEEDTMF